MLLPIALAALVLAAPTGPAAASGTHEEETYWAAAHDLQTGEFLYREVHREAYVDGRVQASHVVYRDSAGDTIAAKILRFDERLATPGFQLEDRRHGYAEGVEVNGDTLALFRRRSRTTDRETEVLTMDGPAVVDGGFDHAVRETWQELMAGGKVAFDFVVPNKLNSYRFRIRKTADTVHDGRPAVRLKIEAANFFVRLIAPDIKLTYDLASRRLQVYEGISNLADPESGKRYRARIEFTYPYSELVLDSGRPGGAGGPQ